MGDLVPCIGGRDQEVESGWDILWCVVVHRRFLGLINVSKRARTLAVAAITPDPVCAPRHWFCNQHGGRPWVVVVVQVDASMAPVSTALGVLGMPGMTAYAGLRNIGMVRHPR
jgi:hypothetical protein